MPKSYLRAMLVLSCGLIMAGLTHVSPRAEEPAPQLRFKPFWQLPLKIPSNLSWSPSGRYLATAYQHSNEPNEKPTPYVLICEPDERNVVCRLPASRDWRDTRPTDRFLVDICWYPNEKAVVWLNSRGELYRASVPDGSIERLAEIHWRSRVARNARTLFDSESATLYYITRDEGSRILKLMALQWEKDREPRTIWPTEREKYKVYADGDEVLVMGKLPEPDQIFFFASLIKSEGDDSASYVHCLYRVNIKDPSQTDMHVVPLPTRYRALSAYWCLHERILIVQLYDLQDPMAEEPIVVRKLWAYDVAQHKLHPFAKYPFESVLCAYTYNPKRKIHLFSLLLLVPQDAAQSKPPGDTAVLECFDRQLAKRLASICLGDSSLDSASVAPHGRLMAASRRFQQLDILEISD